MENCADRESYSLASGLALGLVMLGVSTSIFIGREKIYCYLIFLYNIFINSKIFFIYRKEEMSLGCQI